MNRTVVILAASLVCASSAQPADVPQDGPASLERKLHGEWKGGACMGDWTFAPDGTYKVQRTRQETTNSQALGRCVETRFRRHWS